VWDMFDLLVSYFHQKHHTRDIGSKAVLRLTCSELHNYPNMHCPKKVKSKRWIPTEIEGQPSSSKISIQRSTVLSCRSSGPIRYARSSF
jgi:hypothetical protein